MSKDTPKRYVLKEREQLEEMLLKVEEFESEQKRISVGFRKAFENGDIPEAKKFYDELLVFSVTRRASFYTSLETRSYEKLIEPRESFAVWVIGLDLEPGCALRQKELLALIYELWKRRGENFLFANEYGEMLRTVLKKIRSRPVLWSELDKIPSSVGKKVPIFILLGQYEFYHDEAKRVCRGKRGLQRESAVKGAFQEIKERINHGRFKSNNRREIEPQWVAHNILAEKYSSNPNDVKKELIKARKLRKLFFDITGQDILEESKTELRRLATQTRQCFESQG